MSTSVLFDVGVFVAGLLVLVGAALWWHATGSSRDVFTALALCIPVGWVLTRFPLMVTSVATGIQVPFAPVLLFYLQTFYDTPVALLAWPLTALPAYLVDRRAWSSRLFNAGSSIVSSLLATLVVAALQPTDPVSPAQLFAVLAGAATYFAADTLLSAVSIAIEYHRTLFEELADPGALIGGALFLLVSVLGYLAAAVQVVMPTWIASLILVPGMAVVVAAWAWRRAHQSRAQQRELFEAAVRIHEVTTADDLVAVLETRCATLVSSERLVVRSQAPGGGEVGYELGDEGPLRWIVAPRASNREGQQFDEVALASLGSLASAALVRLRLAAEAERLALVDPLTGLPNRRAFTSRLEQAVGAESAIAVLFVDLDGFKAVNDTLGHAAGDELLCEVADRLRSAAGAGGFAARLGGDEFALVLPDLFPGVADDTAEAVVVTLRSPFLLSAGPATISASVGLTAFEDGDDADSLLSRADAAMYAAKRSGGGRCVLAE
ncbi:diguanylate cyclase domain-containing protein [Kineococcus sp. GCM10028916]|uniref:diguanylate cyclase domain-containing protein n=1 Tax=Kineococcus sp. GCM10028916 TaxID=3273394 RepID=UPI003640C09F